MKLTKIGDFLKRSKFPVDIIDNEEYNRVTIRINHNGVSLRDTAIGLKIGTKKQFILKAGQFIVSKIDARYGAFGIAPNEVDNAIITGNFWAYNVDFSKLNIEWFNQFTNSPDFYDLCERASAGITHRKYLNESFFLNYEIMLPTVEEQLIQIEKIKLQKISSGVLTSELTHQLDLIKQLRQSFLREAMQGKLATAVRSSGVETQQTGQQLLAKIKAEKAQLIAEKKLKKEKPLPAISAEEIPFEIPEHWAWCKLGEICTKVGSGSTPKGSNYAEKGKPFFRSQNIHDNGLVYNDIKFVSDEVQKQMNGTIVLADDILLNITGGSMGRCALVPTDFEEGNVSQHVCIIRPLLSDNIFLHKLVLSPYFQKLIFSSTTGAGREGLPKYNLEQFIIPLPPLHEQEQIVSKLEELMAFCDGLEQSIKESQGYNEMLLQQVLREALQGEKKK
ncbi:restriction endonuclease subunit S [Flavobacterium sp. F-380]|uniref:Restriction endonuclease subunit S n=1 Tax=Flavobacterium kayseriense TaxID=2764714 RepID=A0ABR7J8L5_9FLAO|nr:restriction endonuclease subunit S [Flavobacterium kayseriense]MBC5841802.1 restriction endonuclease subunit S [Flavobacterium kayseriense]MBC5848331.1 restriction endonuclease subunit S [Flavobacterium kayseriense]